MTETNEIGTQLEMAFASPVMSIAIPNADRLNEQLIAEAYAIRAQSEGIHRSNKNGWHSDTDLMSRTEPGLSYLAGLIPKAINMFTKRVVPEFDSSKHSMLVDGWININPQHGFNIPHTHLGFMWSGCYYVQVPKQSEDRAGAIQFLSPWQLPHEMEALEGKVFGDKLTFNPVPGDMLLFPSYLSHWVIPNAAEEDRITIAFNATFVEPK